jgi:phage terminase small subunit
MPPLSNPKHELFAQERAKGVSASWAYVKAGFKRHDSNAARLSKNDKVAARIEEIQGRGEQRAIAKIEADAEKTLIEAARLAFSDIRKLFDENGNLKAVHELDDDTAGAIKKVKVTTQPGKKDEDPVHVTEIEFWSKTDGVKLLGQHFKIFGNGEAADDPLKRFAELMMQAAARPLPLAEPITPALAERATAPARRPQKPIEDAKVIDRVEIEP